MVTTMAMASMVHTERVASTAIMASTAITDITEFTAITTATATTKKNEKTTIRACIDDALIEHTSPNRPLG